MMVQRVFALAFVLPFLQSHSIYGSTETANHSIFLSIKKNIYNNTVLKRGTIPFNTFFSFLTVQIDRAFCDTF